MFEQILDPTGHVWLSVLISLVPLIALLFMLAALRMTAWLASILVGVITIPLGVFVWHAPLAGTVKSYLYGGLTGFWVIDWITFWGLIIFNTLVLTGHFERFKNWMIHHATADIRIQTIMLAWAFGALLEGLVGFGFPWAVVVPILVGLALLPPWVLIYLVSGWEGVTEAWPLAIVGSLSYILGQWPVAHYLGPYLPDLSGALISFWVLFIFVKIWRPKTIRGFGGKPLALSPTSEANALEMASIRQAFDSWMPFLVLILVVVGWTGPWSHLPGFSFIKLTVQAISSVTHTAISSTFNFAPLGGGTSTLASWLIILAILRPTRQQLGQVFSRTFKQMWGALLVAFFIFAIAYTFVYTGMANSLAFGLSKIGLFFVVLAPVLGWVAVALSCSNTSTNAMFGPVQAMTGRLLHLPVLMLPSFNSVGSEVGKPIAPQTASVGVSTSKLVRSEGQVIRHNMGWTLILLAYLILITVLFYYFFPNSMSL